jgi:Protein of unknown function (DUF1524)
MASWTVRLMINGSGGSGPLEDNYSARAKDVSNGTIVTARQLLNAFKILPTDEEFRDAFAKATVSKASIARWYLAKLEITRSGNTEKVVTSDISKANLEHVLPVNPERSWGLSEDDAAKYVNRLGNQAMMDSKANVEIGNSDFEMKRGQYAQSSIELTKEIASYTKWGVDEINDRQNKMAKLAVKTWRNEP